MNKIKLKIGTKIISTTVILILIPIILLGFGSYNISSKMMAKQYEQLGTVIGNEVGSIIDGKIESVEKILDYTCKSPSILNLLENPEEINMLRNIFRRSLDNYGLESIYFGTKNGDMHIESNGDTVNENINPLERPWYKDAIEKDGIVWSDAYIDQITGVHIVTVSMPVYKGDELLGVVGIDLSLDSFTKVMSNIEVSEGGYPILIDESGIIIGYKDASWLGREFEPKSEVLSLKSGIKAINYTFKDEEKGIQGKELIVLRNIERTNWKSATIFPMNTIDIAKRDIIKSVLMIGIGAGVLAIIISILLGKSISGSIKKVLDMLRKLEQGDLTSRIDIKSADEFGEVRDSFNNTLATLSGLINNIKEVSYSVSENSGNLAALSEEVSASSLEISTTSEEIARGASEQAVDTEKGVSLINNLAEQILELDNVSKEMQQFVDNIKVTSTDSTEVVEELKNKTDINNTSIDKVESAILTLDQRIGNISNILITIDQIAEQTNLLALNASIEAARAGEHGRGFAVVAEEIRQLAQESKESSNDIKNIIDNVQSESKHTVEVVKDVKEINKEQTEAVIRVSESFSTIGKIINDIILKINTIQQHSINMNENRNDIVNTIQNISSISQETAAASEEVTASIEQQTAATEDVASSAGNLNELANKLNDEISIFKI